jgi:hypothetical protein
MRGSKVRVLHCFCLGIDEEFDESAFNTKAHQL